MRRARSVVIAGCAVGLLAGCGTDAGSTTRTTLRLGGTNYATLPTTPTTIPTTTLPRAPGEPVVVDGEQTYEVKGGDYGLKVAKMFGVEWEALMSVNGWTSGDDFPQPGVSIRIPPGGIDPTSTLPPTTIAGASGTEAPPPGTTSTTIDTAGQGSYVVKKGDLPVKVAENFDITVEQLRLANGWGPDWKTWPFYEGKTIVIPAKS